MIVIWTGFGFVVPIAALLCMVIAQLLIDAVFGANYYTTHTWPKTAACFFTACILWSLGRWMNKPDPGDYIEPTWGNMLRSSARHTFFFIPVEYWSFALVAFAIFMALK
jgi:hypothetical protein